VPSGGDAVTTGEGVAELSHWAKQADQQAQRSNAAAADDGPALAELAGDEAAPAAAAATGPKEKGKKKRKNKSPGVMLPAAALDASPPSAKRAADNTKPPLCLPHALAESELAQVSAQHIYLHNRWSDPDKQSRFEVW
jgi:hypothetical protein